METTSTFTASDGATLGYRISRPAAAQPSTPAVLLLHGVASNLTRWSEFMEHTQITQHAIVIRPDLRGHASSMYHGVIHMQRWCDDLMELLDHEGIDTIVVVGHSLGAQVAINLLKSAPQRIDGMILIDPVIKQALRGYMRVWPSLRWALGLGAWVMQTWKGLGFGRRKYEVRDLYVLDQNTRKRLNAEPGIDLAELYHNPANDFDFIPMANYFRDMYETLRPIPDLADYPQPKLSLLSQNPTMADPAINRKVLETFPNNAIVVIPANHWPLTEKPVETREAIDQWFLETFVTAKRASA